MREAAAKFNTNTRCGFFIYGHYATGVWNRALVAEHVGSRWEEASRVIIVPGPKAVVSMNAVANIVHREIRLYDLARVYDTDITGPVHGFAEVEVHFGSFRAQAHSAFIVLNRGGFEETLQAPMTNHPHWFLEDDEERYRHLVARSSRIWNR